MQNQQSGQLLLPAKSNTYGQILSQAEEAGKGFAIVESNVGREIIVRPNTLPAVIGDVTDVDSVK